MTFPIQVAIFGAAAMFTIYLLLRDSYNQSQSEYSHGGSSGRSSGGSGYSCPPSYDTHPNNRRRQSNASSNNTQSQCCICMSDLIDPQDSQPGPSSAASANRMLRCGHVFHTECIRTWLRQARDCPICRHYA